MTPTAQARARLERLMARAVARLAERTPQAVWLAESFRAVPDGVMIALYPAPALAARLALPEGEPASELHLTLALPGKRSDLSAEQRARLIEIVRGFGLICPPLAGTFSGVTEFPAQEGVKPVVVLVDVPGLPEWRQRLVDVLESNGFAVAHDHGFLPHITLHYAPEADSVDVAAPSEPVHFDHVTLMLGTERHDYPLGTAGAGPADAFAAAPPAGVSRAELAAVARYEQQLRAEYEAWADELADQLAEAPERDHDELIALALLLLLLRLRQRAAEHLPGAVTLALERVQAAAGAPGALALATAAETAWARLAEAQASNDTYLSESLLPAITSRIREARADAAWRAAMAEGASAFRDWVLGWLLTFAARVASYAGAWWVLHQGAFGDATAGRPIKAYLSPDARHCRDCPRFHSEKGEEYVSFANYLGATGGRLPGEFECKSGCRCFLELGEGVFVTAGDLTT